MPMPTHEIERQAAGWQLRCAQGLSPRQHRQLQQWLAQTPAHRDAFHAMQALDSTLAALPENWRAQQCAQARLRALPAPRSAFWPSSLAACLVLAVVASWQWHEWQQQQPLFSQALSTARGELRQAALPDGSRITLDSATALTVTQYRDRREVILQYGQALFTVQPDRTRPFHVFSGDTRTTVLGTRFAVRHLNQRTHVSVEEGRVQVSLPASRPLIQHQLLAGQQLGSWRGQLGAPGPVPAAAVASWRHGRLIFDDTPLPDAIAEFERYGNSGLRLDDDPRLARLRITGSFMAQQPARFRATLPLALPVKLVAGPGYLRVQARN